MPSVSYWQHDAWKELIIALNKNIIFVNPDDMQIYKEINVPEDLTKCGLIQSHANDDAPAALAKNGPPSPYIQHVEISRNGYLLAVTCSGQKALLLYQLRPEYAKLISVRSLARASSAISFSANAKLLLVTDKTGDCYLFSCEKLQEPGKMILGHLSVVYDVLLTPDEKYVITSDRDLKIRVTNFPNCYDIECYCLGHKEFVSAIKLLPNDDEVLISISGDETIKLWHYHVGEKLCEYKLPAPGIKCATRKVDNNVSHLAVVLYQPNESVAVYEITKDDRNPNDVKFNIKEISRHSFDSTIVTSICYAGERLYVAGIKDEHFTIEYVEAEKSEMAVNVLSMVKEYYQNEIIKPDDVSGWFKKNYDNVTEYYERKKRRIEEKTSKNDDILKDHEPMEFKEFIMSDEVPSDETTKTVHAASTQETTKANETKASEETTKSSEMA